MDQAREEIRAAGGDVVAIFQYRAQPTHHFCRKRGVEFDCLGDPERTAYREVGLDRYGLRQYLLGAWIVPAYLRALRAGARSGKPVGDVAQSPGTFVVGPDRRVVFAHYNKNSADNPSTDDVLEAVQAATTAR